MNELYQECFGHCREDDDCRECDFFASCSCFTGTEDKMEQHSGLVSFEALDGWSDLAADPVSPECGCEPEETEETARTIPPELGPLAEFCRYIFSLDEYTLGILAEVIMPESGTGGRTVADLARLHHCSRQAIHRKMLSSVRRHPELAELFRLALRKIGRGRAYFRRREPCHA